MFKLIREETDSAAALANRNQWPVRYTAVYTEDESPPAIFVMHRSPSPGVFADSLSCIASAIQMSDLPEGEASDGSPFYRVASVTKLCRSSKAALEFVEKVEIAVQDLADNLAAASLFAEPDEVTITPNA